MPEIDQEKQTRQERLQLLLTQLQIPEELISSYFSEGFIQKLVISKEKKSWHFHISLPNLVPASVYQLFEDRLTQTFKHIATVTHSFTYQTSTPTESVWLGYWPMIAATVTDVSDALRNLLKNQTPNYDGRTVTIQVRNETEAIALKRKLADPLNECLGRFGLPNVLLEATYQESTKAFEQFVKNREEEDHSKVVEAMIEKKKQRNKWRVIFKVNHLCLDTQLKTMRLQLKGLSMKSVELPFKGMCLPLKSVNCAVDVLY